eukprot:GHUV01031018.1.p1 GENE.GHUV01031018.1~~GHUV01031018.1.p1  ORF type:complete len:124 (-),score=25.98 GHUV01031018.1:281-652(-)
MQKLRSTTSRQQLHRCQVRDSARSQHRISQTTRAVQVCAGTAVMWQMVFDNRSKCTLWDVGGTVVSRVAANCSSSRVTAPEDPGPCSGFASVSSYALLFQADLATAVVITSQLSAADPVPSFL